MLGFRLRASFVCALVGPLAGFFFESDDALACGGCFHAPRPPTDVLIDASLVTDHRMAFSISPAQTVLWDQIRYSGAPSEFAWALPVRAGARIELSTDAWLAALDASTQTVITGPTPACGGVAPTQYEGGGGGCGSSSSTSGAVVAPDMSASTPSVQVISQSVIGPYESVTVRASQGEALDAWLVANGYEVPPGLQPTIDAYTMAGFDFIALKLRPGQGVQAMQPVRVVTPGADATLPLRMVAAGIGAHVGLELFILSEGRYHTQNFPDATIDFSQLAWDPYQNISTYTTLAEKALAANGGRGWLTQFSGPADLSSFSVGLNPGLRSAYMSTCFPSLPTCTTLAGAGDAGQSTADGGTPDAAPGDDASDAQSQPEAAQPTPPPTCAPPASCDDLALSMTGVAAGSLWVTRLRADLPAAALSTDLVIEATASQVPVTNLHTTGKYTDPKYNPCPSGTGATTGRATASCATEPPRTRYASAIELCMAAAGLGMVLRRRRR